MKTLRLQSTPTQLLVSDAVDIAVAEQITAYDASYVALSQRLNVPLITADEALTRKLNKSAYRVQWLGKLAIPPAP